MSIKASLKFERLLFGGVPEDYRRPKQRPEINDENSEVLGHFHYDLEKGTETFIPVVKPKKK